MGCMAHFVAIPLLTAPAAAFVVDDAHAAAAAAWIVIHKVLIDVDKGGLTAGLVARIRAF